MSLTRTFLKTIRTHERSYTVDISNRKFVGTCEMIGRVFNVMEYILLTNSNNVAIFPVQFMIVEILLSIKTEKCKVKFGEFANERSRMFSQRVPGRDPVDKDGSS